MYFFEPVYIIEALDEIGPAMISSNKAVAPKRACDRYSDDAIDALFENITPEAVIDQTIAFAEKSYEQLMGIYATSNSEVEFEAVRLAIMAEEWKVEFIHDDAYMMVTRWEVRNGKLGRFTWAKCSEDDLRQDAATAAKKGDTVLSKFLGSLADDLLNEVSEDWAERSAYQRKPVRW